MLQGEGNTTQTGKRRSSWRVLLADRWPICGSSFVGWVCIMYILSICYFPKGLGDEGKEHIHVYSGVKRRCVNKVRIFIALRKPIWNKKRTTDAAVSISPQALTLQVRDCKLDSGATWVGPGEVGDRTHPQTHTQHKGPTTTDLVFGI